MFAGKLDFFTFEELRHSFEESFILTPVSRSRDTDDGTSEKSHLDIADGRFMMISVMLREKRLSPLWLAGVL